MNLLDFGLLLLALWIVYYLVKVADAFRNFRRVEEAAKLRASNIVFQESRRHGQAVADAVEWGRASHQGRKAREAVEVLTRG